MATQDAVRRILKQLGEAVGSAELKQIAFELFANEHYFEYENKEGDGCTKYTDEGSCLDQDPATPDKWCPLCRRFLEVNARDFQAIPVC